MMELGEKRAILFGCRGTFADFSEGGGGEFGTSMKRTSDHIHGGGASGEMEDGIGGRGFPFGRFVRGLSAEELLESGEVGIGTALELGAGEGGLGAVEHAFGEAVFAFEPAFEPDERGFDVFAGAETGGAEVRAVAGE
jgi:hypothetical protein